MLIVCFLSIKDFDYFNTKQMVVNSKNINNLPISDKLLGNFEDIKDNKGLEKFGFITNIGTLRFIEIEEYYPETVSREIKLKGDLKNFLEKQFSERRNIEATNMDNLSSWVVEFCEENPELLSELNISNIYNLSPKQAILLSSKITQERLTYSHLQTAIKRNYTPESSLYKYSFGFLGTPKIPNYKVNESVLSRLTKTEQDKIKRDPEYAYNEYVSNIDNAPIDQLLEKDGQGVCRNYAQVVKAIFDTIKNLQSPESSQLINTYCHQSHSFGGDLNKKNAAERIIADNHRWNTFYTVLPNGNIEEVILDVTYTDSGGSESYSKNRMLFELISLVDSKLMTKDQQIRQLEYYVQSIDDIYSSEYRAISEYLGDYYFDLGDKKSGVKWYMINPSMKSLQNIKETKNLSEKDLSNIVEHIVGSIENGSNVRYAGFLSEYFYQKKDYRKSIDYGLIAMKYKFDYDNLLILIVSCIKNGSEEWIDNNYSVQTFLHDPDSFREQYPQEIDLILYTYIHLKKVKTTYR